MPVLSGYRNDPQSIVQRGLAWCREQIGELFPMLSKSRESRLRAPDTEDLNVPRYCYDGSLLFQRMARLQIDRDELAREDPLLLRELGGICALCGSKGECVGDLARESETGEPQDWQDYCPNAAALNVLGALQNCPRATQYLKKPRA